MTRLQISKEMSLNDMILTVGVALAVSIFTCHPWRWRQKIHLKHCYLFTKLYWIP